MASTRSGIKNAVRIDFTGKLSGGSKFTEFSPEVVSLVRSPVDSKVAVVIDTGFGMQNGAPVVVRDHLNLTGTNPLVGPNDPCGERFPSVNEIYIVEGAESTSIAAGLKKGVVPSADDVAFIKTLGADCYCYNLVPTMIVAAHAGWKILGIVAPEGADANTIKQLIDKLGE